MSTSAIGNFSSSYLQQVLAGALQSAGVTSGNTNTANSASSPSQSDSSQLSPFAQLASSLQQLQQSNPTEYTQVTEQISTNLQSAAQTATSQGNTSAASQLTHLASDFTTASQTGQLPNLQDLSQAVGGSSGGHHHHHAQAASTDSTTASFSSSTSSNSARSTSPALNQLLASLQQTSDSQSSQNASIDPGTIILQTLANAGISTSRS